MTKFDLHFAKKGIIFLQNFWWGILGHLLIFDLSKKEVQLWPYFIENKSNVTDSGI